MAVRVRKGAGLTARASLPSISVIVASGGRATLAAALASIAPQLLAGDELLVDVNDDAPWGNKARNRMAHWASGDALAFCDDDDTFAPEALSVMRGALLEHPQRPHIFRMRYADGMVLWSEPVLREGNVGTPMICVPNLPGRLGRFGDRYEGDFDFIAGTVTLAGAPIWHEEIVALIRPHGGS